MLQVFYGGLDFARSLTLREQAIWSVGFTLGVVFGLQGWLVAIVGTVLLLSAFLLVRMGQDLKALNGDRHETTNRDEELIDG